MDSGVKLRAAAVALVVLLSSANVQAQTAVAELKIFTRDLETLSGRFTQEVRDKHGRVSRQSAGSFVLARPGKFRFNYEKPYKQLIVSDGQNVTIFDEDLNQVTIRKLGDTLAEQPLALLLEPARVESLFELQSEAPAGSVQFVSARPKRPDASFSDLQVALVERKPKEIRWRDALQNENTLRFETLSKNARVAADVFSFTPPKGADVLRN